MPKIKYSLFFFFVCGIILLLPFIFVMDGPQWCDFSDKGQVGDVIGGTTAPFIAIVAAYLTFLAFWVQYQYNKKQRHDVEIERFERVLFEMISSQESITNSLVLELLESNQDTSSKTFEESVLFRQKGRDTFQCIYEYYPIAIRKQTEHKDLYEKVEYQGLRELFMNDSDGLYHYSQYPVVGMFDHYFRHLYWIFKYIRKAEVLNDEAKYMYACIVRSSLSQYELVLLYYNGLSNNGQERFKTIIEEFALLNNLRFELLASKEEIEKCKQKVEAGYKFESDNLMMPKEYKKSAFVYKKSTEMIC